METANQRKSPIAVIILLASALFFVVIRRIITISVAFIGQVVPTATSVLFLLVEISMYALFFVYATFFWKKGKAKGLLPIGFLVFAFYELMCMVEMFVNTRQALWSNTIIYFTEAILFNLPLIVFLILAGVNAFKGLNKKGFILAIAIINFVFMTFSLYNNVISLVQNIRIMSDGVLSGSDATYYLTIMYRALISNIFGILARVLLCIGLLVFVKRSVTSSAIKAENVSITNEQETINQPVELSDKIEAEETSEKENVLDGNALEGKLEEAKQLANFCTACGRKFNESELFCANCGQKR
ncbi:MAG: zinc ribbon domain-containing protein [Clostridiales bacterium]|nr:zinc ribbon domain-containing protein [Clostridiales bacterium]